MAIQLEGTQLLGQVPYGAIIAAPLTAAVAAQAAAAQACVDFIRNAGVNGDGTVKTVVFRFTKAANNPDAERRARALLNIAPDTECTDDQKKALDKKVAELTGPVSAMIEVPLLSLMPIPFLRIDNLTIAMKTTINATTESTTQNAASNTLEGKADGSVGWGPLKVGFSGGISSKKDSSATSTSKYSVEHTIDINIHAAQDDMPGGLAKLLNILNDNIRVMTEEKGQPG